MKRHSVVAFIAACAGVAIIGCSQNNPVEISNDKVHPTRATAHYPTHVERQAIVYQTDQMFSFAVLADDGDLWVQQQSGTTCDDALSWMNGGINLNHPFDGKLAPELAVGIVHGSGTYDNHMVIFAICPANDYRIWLRMQTEPNSTSFTDWQPTGYTCPAGGHIAVSNYMDGSLALFWRQDVNTINSITIPADGNMSSPQSLGTNSDGIVSFSVAKNTDGRLEVFTTGNNSSRVYHTWQWTDMLWAGSYFQCGPVCPSTIRTDADIGWVINQSNNLEIFVNGNDDNLYNCWYNGSDWAGWDNPATGVYKRFAVGRRYDRDVSPTGGIDILYCHTPAVWDVSMHENYYPIYYAYQEKGTNAWNAWERGTPTPGTSKILESEIDNNNLSTFNHPCGKLLFFFPENYYLGTGWDNVISEYYEDIPVRENGDCNWGTFWF